MSTNYVGEIRLVGFNYAPQGWFLCQGQTLSISGYEVLYTLLGTTYGGDGVQTFGLPDLRGRAPMHVGTGMGISYVLGQISGSETVSLTTPQVPVHVHAISAQSGAGSSTSPSNTVFSGSNGLNQYVAAGPSTTGVVLGPSTGTGAAHNNLMPYLTANYIIAWAGIYPSQS